MPAVSAPAEAWDGRLGDAEYGPFAALDHENQHFRWFDYHLKGIDNGLEHEAPIRIFVMGDNVWRDEWEWPLSRAIPTRLYLHSRVSATVAWPPSLPWTSRQIGTCTTLETRCRPGEGPSAARGDWRRVGPSINESIKGGTMCSCSLLIAFTWTGR